MNREFHFTLRQTDRQTGRYKDENTDGQTNEPSKRKKGYNEVYYIDPSLQIKKGHILAEDSTLIFVRL